MERDLALGIKGREALIAGGSASLGYAAAAMPAADKAELFLSAQGEDRLSQAAATLHRRQGLSIDGGSIGALF